MIEGRWKGSAADFISKLNDRITIARWGERPMVEAYLAHGCGSAVRAGRRGRPGGDSTR